MTVDAYRAAVEEAAVRRSPEDVFRVTGDDAAEHLDRILSRPVADLEAGETRRSLLLSTEGRTRATLRLRRLEDGFLVVSRRAESLRSDWRSNVFREDVEFHDVDSVVLEVRGPEARDHVSDAAVTVEAAQRGVDVVLAADEADDVLEGLPTLDDVEAEALRVEAGAPASRDLRDRIPLAAASGLVGFERCYPGQEVVARVAQRGGGPGERFVGFSFDGEPPAADVDADEESEAWSSAEGDAELTSVIESPRLGWIALGYLDDDAGDAHVFGGVSAEVQELPFDEGVRA